MRLRRAPPVLPSLFVAAVLQTACDGTKSALPVEPTEADPAVVSVDSKPQTPIQPVSVYSAEDLLADPLLQLIIAELDVPSAANAISTAIEAARANVLAGDIAAAKADVEAAFDALADYQSVRALQDEDVLLLAAVERFLDEAEAAIGFGAGKGIKEKNNKR